MRYKDVCIEAIGYVLPDRRVTSAAIEKWLRPVYERLHLPEGRLELMTGIRERRFWKRGTRPSTVSARAGAAALEKAGVSPDDVGCLLHCSVSRDFVEPATSTVVHKLLKLPSHAMNFDISNACLGVVTGMVMMANMIQLGQIETGVIVSGEHGGPLVEGTVERLLNDPTLTRKSIKSHVASLTIGSAAAAVVMTHASKSRTGHRLLGAVHSSDTTFNHLCQGNADCGMTDSTDVAMMTDSHELLVRGIEVAAGTWQLLEKEIGWTRDTPDAICGHQVGKAHREALYERVGLDPRKDFSTYEFLGNCGSASLPVTAAMAEEAGHLKPGDNVALMGIGSGINCAILAATW
jgi:3-oxoacyl-[acyl-carrier-protein] synthase-3